MVSRLRQHDRQVPKRSSMLEKTIEKYFKEQLEKHGALVIKLNIYNFNGFPDRMILLPGERVFFAELKRPGEKPRKLQGAVHRMLRKLGFRVYVIDSKEQIKGVVANEVHTAQLPADSNRAHT